MDDGLSVNGVRGRELATDSVEVRSAFIVVVVIGAHTRCDLEAGILTRTAISE